MNKTKEEIELIYGTLPPLLDIDKMNVLLNKKPNKYTIISNVYSEVLDWIYSINVNFQEFLIEVPNLKGNIEKVKSINIEDKLILIVVDDYTIYNKKNLGKDISTKIHKEWMDKGYRVVWCKKFEWENPNKKRVMQSLISHALGKTTNKVFARKTVAEIIPNKELRKFFDDSSFYGYRNASEMAVCLKDKETGEILEAMSFGKPYYGKNKYGELCVECIRSASKPFTMVVGGMSKLMKFYIEQFGNTFDSIVYYVDDAHYQSKTMDFLGFEYSHFSGCGVHNVWNETGSQFMRTPALHKEIKFMQEKGEIYAVPDVGNTIFLYKKEN